MSTIKAKIRAKTGSLVSIHVLAAVAILTATLGSAALIASLGESSFMVFGPSPLNAKKVPTTNRLLDHSLSGLLKEQLTRPLSDILRTCPTDGDIAQFRKDFNIIFDKTVANDPSFWNPICVNGNPTRPPIIRLYDTFRVMREISFSAPLPIVNNRNLYDWLRESGLEQIRVFAPQSPSDHSHGWDHRLAIRADTLMHDIPSSGLSYEQLILGQVALLVHEGFHAQTNIGHTCNTPQLGNDESLEFGGAWAVQFYYYRWLAEQSGAYLDSAQKRWARARAIEHTQSAFCHISPALQQWIDENR